MFCFNSLSKHDCTALQCIYFRINLFCQIIIMTLHSKVTYWTNKSLKGKTGVCPIFSTLIKMQMISSTNMPITSYSFKDEIRLRPIYFMLKTPWCSIWYIRFSSLKEICNSWGAMNSAPLRYEGCYWIYIFVGFSFFLPF